MYNLRLFVTLCVKSKRAWRDGWHYLTFHQRRCLHPEEDLGEKIHSQILPLPPSRKWERINNQAASRSSLLFPAPASTRPGVSRQIQVSCSHCSSHYSALQSSISAASWKVDDSYKKQMLHSTPSFQMPAMTMQSGVMPWLRMQDLWPEGLRFQRICYAWIIQWFVSLFQ